jgi:hypothetical protein
MHAFFLAVVVAIAFTGASISASLAYDRGNCNAEFGHDRVGAATTFKRDFGAVDFGDELHLGGVPQGTAVICWLIDGGVSIIGRLYADRKGTARVTFRFCRTNGNCTSSTNRSVENRDGWSVTNRYITKTRSGTSGNFSRVRITLQFSPGFGNSSGAVVPVTFSCAPSFGSGSFNAPDNQC